MYIKDLILEKLESEPSLVLKAMFGCHAFYLHGRLMLVAAEQKKQEWRGILVGMERENHPEMIKKMPELSEHPVLKKWLFLSEKNDKFEELAQRLIQLAKQNEESLGVYGDN
jgi:hypothetical protein